MAVDHYENFPVASLLLPRRLRVPVKDIYCFARTADDIADEGAASAAQRLEQLGRYREALLQIRYGELKLAHDDPLRRVFGPLEESIRRFSLPLDPFLDLLSAFEQDISTTRYADDARLMDYCRRSANPVGRLMLHLYEADTPHNVAQSDSICTGLQLTNFWQDVAIDWSKQRVYIPQENLQRHGVHESYIAAMSDPARNTDFFPAQEGATAAWRALMQAQVRQARGLLLNGLPLAQRLPGRIGFELKLVVQGGLRILERLDQLHYDVFLRRPVLTKRDWLVLFWRASTSHSTPETDQDTA